MTTPDPAYNLNPFYKVIDCHWDGGAPTPGSGQMHQIWVWPGQQYTLETVTTIYTGTCGPEDDPQDNTTGTQDGPALTTVTHPGVYSGPTGAISRSTLTSCPCTVPLFSHTPARNGSDIDIAVIQSDDPGPPPNPATFNIFSLIVGTINEVAGPGIPVYEFTDVVFINLAVQKAIGTGFFAPLDIGEHGRAERIQAAIAAQLDTLWSGKGGVAPVVLIYDPPPDPGP